MLSLTEPTEKDKPETEVDTLEFEGDSLEQEQPEQAAQAPRYKNHGTWIQKKY